MSGGNLQPFVTNYKPEDAEQLTVRMKNGLGSSKYKSTDYEKLQAVFDAKRLEVDLIGQKVQKTCCAAKATKESSLLRQHRQVWSREHPRLQKAEEQAEGEIHNFITHIRPMSITDTPVFSLQEYDLSLRMEQEEFMNATVDPIYQLKDDLRFRMNNVQLKELSSDSEQVTQQINSVKAQQDDTLAKLHAEYLLVENEIFGMGLEKYLVSAPVNPESIPKEVLEADFPYPKLKDSLVQTFQSLSERYQNRLQALQEQLQKIDRFCGWCPEDHELFQFTVSMYTPDTPNHRALCMDMLLRQFPERTRQELREHERLWDLQRFTQAQMRAVTQGWHRDQGELLARALVMLEEAEHAHQEELKHHRERQHQQDICLQLKEKLQQWRAQQEEVAKLEEAIAARQQEEREERMKREQEKEAAIRSQQKEKVRRFYLRQQKRREVLEWRDQERLAALRSIMDKQARRDRERVQFRADLLQERKQREARELEQQREEQERQDRLVEALRKQVEVVAEADPERMMADTEAWRSRLKNEKAFELQRPLYSINTYTDTQIVSDPRVRAEQALREAGLHQGQYAKRVLSDIKPHKPPRRDMKSTLKF